jgi:hypothetical protein
MRCIFADIIVNTIKIVNKAETKLSNLFLTGKNL